MSAPPSARQRRLLKVLEATDMANVTYLAHATTISPGYVRTNVVPMLAAGWVTRATGLYRITAAGRAALADSVGP